MSGAGGVVGSDQMAKIVKVIDAIIHNRGISQDEAAKEMGYCGASALSNWRIDGCQQSAIQRQKADRVRLWILKWKHVLKRPAA